MPPNHPHYPHYPHYLLVDLRCIKSLNTWRGCWFERISSVWFPKSVLCFSLQRKSFCPWSLFHLTLDFVKKESKCEVRRSHAFQKTFSPFFRFCLYKSFYSLTHLHSYKKNWNTSLYCMNSEGHKWQCIHVLVCIIFKKRGHDLTVFLDIYLVSREKARNEIQTKNTNKYVKKIPCILVADALSFVIFLPTTVICDTCVLVVTN